jgi:hypothetical protein
MCHDFAEVTTAAVVEADLDESKVNDAYLLREDAKVVVMADVGWS